MLSNCSGLKHQLYFRAAKVQNGQGTFHTQYNLSMQWWMADFFPNDKTCSSTSLFFQTLSWKENLPSYTQVIGTAGKVRAG